MLVSSIQGNGLWTLAWYSGGQSAADRSIGEIVHWFTGTVACTSVTM